MSVVFNYVSRYISIVATDTRISFGKDAEFGYQDGVDKLVNLPQMGWSAGAGFASFLDVYKDRVGAEEIIDPNRVAVIFDEVFEEAIVSEPHFADHIKESVASLSWVGLVDGEVQMRLGLLSQKFKNDERGSLGLVLDDSFSIFYPSNYLENPDMVEAFEKANDLNFTYNPADSDSFIGLISKIATMFCQISDNSAGVSNVLDVGVLRFTSDGLEKLKITITVEKQDLGMNLNFSFSPVYIKLYGSNGEPTNSHVK